MADRLPNPSLEEVLSRLSLHLDNLASRIYDVEEALGNSLTSDQPEISSIQKLQSLDFVRQSLEDCALLVHLLGVDRKGISAKHIDLHDLSRKLKLDTTKLLLSRENTAVRGDQRCSATGDIDLF